VFPISYTVALLWCFSYVSGQLWLLIILFNKKIRIKLGFWRQQWKCLKRELASGTPQFIYFNEPLKTNFYLYFTHAALACPVYCAYLKSWPLQCVPISWFQSRHICLTVNRGRLCATTLIWSDWSVCARAAQYNCTSWTTTRTQSLSF